MAHAAHTTLQVAGAQGITEVQIVQAQGKEADVLYAEMTPDLSDALSRELSEDEACDFLRRFDIATFLAPAGLERIQHALQRLANPTYFDDGVAETFRMGLTDGFADICTTLAQAEWCTGFDLLADVGILDAHNIAQAHSAALACGSAAASAHLLTMQTTRFNTAQPDFTL